MEAEKARKEREERERGETESVRLQGTMTDDWVNEEGEMMMAYQSAKDTNRLLEAQLQAMTKNFKLQEKELRDEIGKHKNEIEKQQRIISEVRVYLRNAGRLTTLKLIGMLDNLATSANFFKRL